MKQSLLAVLMFGAGMLTAYVFMSGDDPAGTDRATADRGAAGVVAGTAGAHGASESGAAEALGAEASVIVTRGEPSDAGTAEPSAAARRLGVAPFTAGAPGTAPTPARRATAAAGGQDRRDADPAGDGRAGDAEPRDPIPVIEGMRLDGMVGDLHDQLEQEPPDLGWSGAMEVQILTYLASKPNLVQQFSLPSVACRQTGCMVQAIGYGPMAFQMWQAETQDMQMQPWAQEFGRLVANTNVLGPDVQGIVLIMERITVEFTVQSIEPDSAKS
jgi:hypothetical protein